MGAARQAVCNVIGSLWFLWLVAREKHKWNENKKQKCLLFSFSAATKKKKQTKIFLTHLQVNSFSPKHISRQSRRELALVLRLT